MSIASTVFLSYVQRIVRISVIHFALRSGYFTGHRKLGQYPIYNSNAHRKLKYCGIIK